MARKGFNKGVRVSNSGNTTSIKIGWPVIIVVLLIIGLCMYFA